MLDVWQAITKCISQEKCSADHGFLHSNGQKE